MTEPTAPYPGMPRWVKRAVLATLGILVVVAVVFAITGGEHSPGRHLGGDGTTTHAPGHKPPPGAHGEE